MEQSPKTTRYGERPEGWVFRKMSCFQMTRSGGKKTERFKTKRVRPKKPQTKIKI